MSETAFLVAAKRRGPNRAKSLPAEVVWVYTAS
jgi:hypothetical protein